jgi:pimeloyl-ACP methyl ester carboxylesterase
MAVGSVHRAPPLAPLVARGDVEGTVVADDGTRLFVRSRNGDHPEAALRAVLCDGILCDGFIWKYAWSDFAAVMPISHWNYRGHGRSASPANPDRIGIGAHADDLNAVRRALGDPPVVLVGHSMGTQVALEAFHRAPERVAGIVLICGSFGRVTSTVRGMPILDLVLPKLLDAVTRRPSLARAVWSRIPPEATVKLAFRTGDLIEQNLRMEDMLPYVQHVTHIDLPMFLRMLRAAGDHSAWDYLGTIETPVLVLAAERDTFTPHYLAEAMVRAMPDAEIEVVPGTSHVLPLERPSLVARRFASFVKERARVRAAAWAGA